MNVNQQEVEDANSSTSALQYTNIDKQYPGVHALEDINLNVEHSTIHGLVGENGAGKSTLMKLTSGAEFPSKGMIKIYGNEIHYGNPKQIISQGLALLYQEVNLINGLSVVDNILLGQTPTNKISVIDRSKSASMCKKILQELQIDINLEADVEELPLADKRLIQILRSLAQSSRIICLDEPTAALGYQERNNLKKIILQLKKNKQTVILISHDHDDVFEICDNITVMRDGKIVDTKSTLEWNKQLLFKSMTGKDLQNKKNISSEAKKDKALSIKNLSYGKFFQNLNFDLFNNEILGLAGLTGSGRSEILHCLCGAVKQAKGDIFFNKSNVTLKLPYSIKEAIKNGIVLSPEERRHQGLVLSLNAATNSILSNLFKASNSLLKKNKNQFKASKLALENLDFDIDRLNDEASNFSGGNQQKIVLGKCFHAKPKILLLDEATRGIDVGAKDEIFETMRKIAQQDTSVIFVSSEIEELIAICDRILVLSEGQFVSELFPKDFELEKILQLIFEKKNVHSKYN